MKICFVGLNALPVLAREYNCHGVGGAELQMSLVAQALIKRNYEVSMVVADYDQQDGKIWSGIRTYKTYRLDAGLPVIRFIYPRWTTVWNALKRADADVYFTSCAGMMVGLIALFCAYFQRGFVFRMAHDWDCDPNHVLIRLWRDKKIYEYGLRRSDVVLCQNNRQQIGLRKNYEIDGVLIKSFVESPSYEFDLPQRDISVLWVSNVRSIKRPDLALELSMNLPSYSFHMIGGVVPGFTDLYEKLKNKASSLPNLIFHGRVPYHEVGDYFDRSRVFVNTSDSEGFPNTYLQAWRRGVPVVAFFDPDGIIQREGLGFAVNSMEEMQQAVQKLLVDDDTWHICSARCRTYMGKVHGDDVVLKPYIEAFETAVRKRKAV